jgi:hypothetical protein
VNSSSRVEQHDKWQKNIGLGYNGLTMTSTLAKKNFQENKVFAGKVQCHSSKLQLCLQILDQPKELDKYKH